MNYEQIRDRLVADGSIPPPIREMKVYIAERAREIANSRPDIGGEKNWFRRAHGSDVGYDIRTLEAFTINPGETKVFPTGLIVDLPGWNWTETPWRLQFRITTRTGNGIKGTRAAAVIFDAGYRPLDQKGEWLEDGWSCAVSNVGLAPLSFRPGDKVMQGVFLLGFAPEVVLVDSTAEIIKNTERGGGRFGGTGA